MKYTIVVEYLPPMPLDDLDALKQKVESTGQVNLGDPKLCPFEVRTGDNVYVEGDIMRDVGYIGVTPSGQMFRAEVIDPAWIKESNVSKW